jgi:predicted metal-binding membrane protein
MDMGGMDMAGFRMIPAGIGIMAPANAPWRAVEFAFVFAMWAMMMVGMMAPSAAPMILTYTRVGRQAKAAGKPLAATGWFASGYFLAWIGFPGNDLCPMGSRTGGFARFPDGKR